MSSVLTLAFSVLCCGISCVWNVVAQMGGLVDLQKSIRVIDLKGGSVSDSYSSWNLVVSVIPPRISSGTLPV